MAKNYTDIASVVGGVVRYKDLGYLVFISDAVAAIGKKEEFLKGWNNGKIGKFGDDTMRCHIVGCAIAPKPREQGVFVGEYGEVMAAGSGEQRRETIGTETDGPKTRGALRCTREIAGKVYAAGMDRQVYRRDDANKWVACDAGARPPKGSKEVVGFEGIDGFSENEIYAAGWDGEIWQSDGQQWRQIDSPTNVLFTAMCCAGDGKVYACGRQGLLVCGRGDEWEVLSPFKGFPFDLWGVCWFDGKLYLSGIQQLFTYSREEGFKIVTMGEEQVSTCYKLSARDGVMWSIGAKDVMSFDGKVWTRIE